MRLLSLLLVCLCIAAGRPAKVIILNDGRFLDSTGIGAWKDSFGLIQVPFSTNDCSVLEKCNSAGDRRLLVFELTIVNIGDSTFWLPSITNRPDLFVFDPCHNHYHLLNWSRFDLFNCDGVPMVSGQKMGWCVVPTQRFDPNAPPLDEICTCTVPCMSAGYGDTYNRGTPCMWLDVTGLTNGFYTMRAALDPLGVYGVSQAVEQAIYLSDTSITNAPNCKDQHRPPK